ncbi:hypothetical protein, partial [Bacillus cereus]|uniref:hypothetical protein n=1 Tax=Bacillus cereus TaxID=1396 RepID=UPI00366E51BF
AAHPFGELRQFVPGLLGALEARGEPADLVLQVRLAAQCLAQFALGGFLAFLERGLVGDLGLQRLTQPYEVVGEEAALLYIFTPLYFVNIIFLLYSVINACA